MAYAHMIEGLDTEGRQKIDAQLVAPLPGERPGPATPAEKPRSKNVAQLRSLMMGGRRGR